jgi:[ribosomal protein S5]-alanine N-acetyltransferase
MIETERLLIRPFTRADAEELLSIWGDPANERFLRTSPPSSIAEVCAWFEKGMPWGVWERATSELIGDCALFTNEDGEVELAYGFRRDRWGRGYASEAAAACVRHGFEQLNVHRIVADIDPTNGASRRVLEKLGFEHAGEQDGKALYALTRDSARKSQRMD